MGSAFCFCKSGFSFLGECGWRETGPSSHTRGEDTWGLSARYHFWFLVLVVIGLLLDLVEMWGCSPGAGCTKVLQRPCEREKPWRKLQWVWGKPNPSPSILWWCWHSFHLPLQAPSACSNSGLGAECSFMLYNLFQKCLFQPVVNSPT